MPAADLAQSAAAIRRLRGQGQGHPGHAPACRRNASHPQPCLHGGSGRGAVCKRQECRRSDGLARQGRVVIYCYHELSETEVAMLARDEDILKAAEDWRRKGRGVALATVVETWGSAPR